MDSATDAILDSDLPAAQQVTLMHMTRQAQGNLFVGTHADIAEARGVSRSAVSQQVRSLLNKDWIEKCGQALRITLTPDTSEDGGEGSADGSPSSADGSIQKGFPPRPPKKDNHSTPLTPPSQVLVESADANRPPWLEWIDEKAWEAEDLADDHAARWEYHPGDWRFDYAKLSLKRMREHEMLSPMTEKKIERESEGAVSAEWADTFRKLVDLDGYSRDDIETALRWLFSGGNFWTDEGGIASVTALRKKTRTGDRRKFDVIYQQATSNSGGDGGRSSVPTEPDPEAQERHELGHHYDEQGRLCSENGGVLHNDRGYPLRKGP